MASKAISTSWSAAIMWRPPRQRLRRRKAAEPLLARPRRDRVRVDRHRLGKARADKLPARSLRQAREKNLKAELLARRVRRLAREARKAVLEVSAAAARAGEQLSLHDCLLSGA